MLYVARVILMLMISTSMTFARTVEVDHMEKISDAFENLDSKSAEAHEEEGRRIVMEKLEREIQRAEKKNEELSVSMEKMNKSLTHYFEKRSSTAKSLLAHDKKLSKVYKRASKANPELTQEEFVANLESMTNENKNEEIRAKVLGELKSAGSYSQFLKKSKAYIFAGEDDTHPAVREAITWVVIIAFFGWIASMSFTLFVICAGMMVLFLAITLTIYYIQNYTSIQNQGSETQWS